MDPIAPRTKSIGLVGHVIACYPDHKAALSMMAAMVEHGVAAIEVQIPFSEPMADGPLFMKANQDALLAGVTVTRAWDFIQDAAQTLRVPIITMTYANVAFKTGLGAFARRMKQAGSHHLIVPDFPIDAGIDLLTPLSEAGVGWIPLLAPSTDVIRMEQLTSAGSGFAYCVARAGVTGVKSEIDGSTKQYLQGARAHSKLPTAVGFGIQDGAGVASLIGVADFAIVGSKTLATFQSGGLSAVSQLWSSLKVAAGGLKT
jgi:tryptophan synthase alpha chain